MGTRLDTNRLHKTKPVQLDLVIDTPETETRMRSLKKRLPQKGQAAWFYLGFIGEIGFSIAIPIAGGAMLGSFLDKQFASYPKLTVSLLFLGIIVSFVGFFRSIQEIIKRKP